MQPKSDASASRRDIAIRVVRCTKTSIPKALKTAAWLLAVMLPVTLVVTLLEYFGVVAWLSKQIAPFFTVVGLPVEAPFVFLTGAFLGLYPAIAVMGSFALSIREVTILAIMCLLAHNLIVETAVQSRAGSFGPSILALRLVTAFAAAVALSAVLPRQGTTTNVSDPSTRGVTAETETAAPEPAPVPRPGLRSGRDQVGSSASGLRHTDDHSLKRFMADAPAVLGDWAASGIATSLKIVLVVAGLMLLQSLLTEFGVVGRMTRRLGPLLRVFGLPENTHFLWIVANTLGLAYGSAVIIDEVESGRLDRRAADLLNRHIAVSHSLLEDTLLFVAVGVGVFWITVPRVLIAVAVVWSVRLVRKITRGRDGTAE